MADLRKSVQTKKKKKKKEEGNKCLLTRDSFSFSFQKQKRKKKKNVEDPINYKTKNMVHGLNKSQDILTYEQISETIITTTLKLTIVSKYNNILLRPRRSSILFLRYLLFCCCIFK